MKNVKERLAKLILSFLDFPIIFYKLVKNSIFKCISKSNKHFCTKPPGPLILLPLGPCPSPNRAPGLDRAPPGLTGGELTDGELPGDEALPNGLASTSRT